MSKDSFNISEKEISRFTRNDTDSSVWGVRNAAKPHFLPLCDIFVVISSEARNLRDSVTTISLNKFCNKIL
jgi:hypothetical protein